MEQFYQLAVNEILPGFFVNKGTHVGGPSCTIAIDGAGFEGKTKSAFPDNTLLIPGNKRAIREAIYVEYDENDHNSYDVTCELSKKVFHPV